MSRRLPADATVTQVTELDGAVVILTADEAGRIKRLAADGTATIIESGLSRIAEIHRSGTVSIARADGKLWRRQGESGWTEMSAPGGGPPGSGPAGIRALNGEFWMWTAGGVFLANGSLSRYFARLHRSSDALHWTTVEVAAAPALQPVTFSDLEHADGRYVLTGNAYQLLPDSLSYVHAGGIWTSRDGATWTREGEADGTYSSVAFGGGMWMAGGDSGRYATSPDGDNWTVREHPFIAGWIGNDFGSVPQRSSLLDVVWLPSGFHAITHEGYFGQRVAVSPDGLSWSTDLGVDGGDFPAGATLSAVQGQAWLHGTDGTVWRSADWRWTAARVLPAEPSDWSVVMASSTRAVVLGNEGRAGWSDDGRHWNFVSFPGSGAVPAAGTWAADRREFLAVGSAPVSIAGTPSEVRAWRSSDGITWGGRSMPGGRKPVGIQRGKGFYVVAFEDGALYRSADGLAWEPGLIGSGFEAPAVSLAFDGVMFVMLNARGGLLTSSDGLVWNARPGPAPYVQDVRQSMAVGGGLWFVTDGFNSYVSDDLRTWSPGGGNVFPGPIIHVSGEFVGSGYRGLLSSTDGMAWTARGGDSVNEHPLNAMVEFRNGVLAVGDNGRIFQSEPWRDFVGEWKQSVFTPAQQADSAVSADDSDADADGVPTLLEYALGLDPLKADGRQSVAMRLVRYGGVTDKPDAQVNLAFPSWSESPGVQVWVERSDDLRQWRRDGLRVGYARTGHVAANGRQIWSRELAVGGDRGWMRLRARRVPAPSNETR